MAGLLAGVGEEPQGQLCLVATSVLEIGLDLLLVGSANPFPIGRIGRVAVGC